MTVQIAARFRATRFVKLTFGFWRSVGETIGGCVFLCLLLMRPFAGGAEIDDISHE